MQGKFSGAFAKWLQLRDVLSIPPTNEIPLVSGFPFNPETSNYSQRTGDSTTCLCTFICHQRFCQYHCAGIYFCGSFLHAFKWCCAGCRCKKIIIPYNHQTVNASQGQLLIGTKPGAIVITALSLGYRHTNGLLSSNTAFML